MRLLTLLTLFFMTGIGTLVHAQKSLPDVNLKTLKNQQVALKTEIEKADLTVLSFWATWCAPCKRELNTIVDIYPDWQENYNMQIIAVTIDDQRQLPKVPGIVSVNNWEYTVLSDQGRALQNALNITSIPRTMLVNKAGEILYDHQGYKPGDELELEEKMKSHSSAKN